MYNHFQWLTLIVAQRWRFSWWRHQMETFSALLAICAGNSTVTCEFPAERPVMRSFDVFFDLRLNKRLSKQSWGWWFETPSCPLRRHSNVHVRLCCSPGIVFCSPFTMAWGFSAYHFNKFQTECILLSLLWCFSSHRSAWWWPSIVSSVWPRGCLKY